MAERPGGSRSSCRLGARRRLPAAAMNDKSKPAGERTRRTEQGEKTPESEVKKRDNPPSALFTGRELPANLRPSNNKRARKILARRAESIEEYGQANPWAREFADKIRPQIAMRKAREALLRLASAGDQGDPRHFVIRYLLPAAVAIRGTHVAAILEEPLEHQDLDRARTVIVDLAGAEWPAQEARRLARSWCRPGAEFGLRRQELTILAQAIADRVQVTRLPRPILKWRGQSLAEAASAGIDSKLAAPGGTESQAGEGAELPAHEEAGQEEDAGSVSVEKPLTYKERTLLEILASLPQAEGRTGMELIASMADRGVHGVTQSSLTSRLIPGLRERGWKIPTRTGVGYYLTPQDRERFARITSRPGSAPPPQHG